MTHLSTHLVRAGCYATLVLAGCAPAWAHQGFKLTPPPANRAYGFSYRFTGNPSAYPIQAFRGRHALYVQYPHKVHPREAWVWRGHDYQHALLVREGPYYAIVPTAARTRVMTTHGTAIVWAANAVPGTQVRARATQGAGTSPSSAQSVIAHGAMGQAITATAASGAASQTVTHHPAPARVMMLRAQRLSQNMRRFLAHHHWHLAWRSSQDYAVPYPYVLRGPDTVAILRQLAHLYALRIHIYHGNRVVVVTIPNPLTRRLTHASH